MEHKSLSLEIKAEDEGVVTGYGSVFDVIDGVGDRVERGAFAESLKMRTPKMLWQHDMYDPIGVWTEVREDEKGLYVKGQLAMKSTRGKDAYELIKIGAMDAMSIGYRTKDYEMEGNNRVLKAVDLYEVSMVTLPANHLALIDTVKSGDMTERDFEALLRSHGFSRSEAKAITSGGFKGYRKDLRDAGTPGPEQYQRDADDLKQLLTEITQGKGVQK